MFKEIAFTKVNLPYGWLGNMSAYPVVHNGKEWRTTEALFQALRFNDEEIRESIRLEKSPMGCKMKTKSIIKTLTAQNQLFKRVVEPLSPEDVRNMEFCLRLKLEKHPRLLTELIKTNNIPIYEDVTSRGKRGSNVFWGAIKTSDGNWEGQNILGNLWMKLRTEIDSNKGKMVISATSMCII
jgi:predicted NAD-dependent protein-ADP-ribosyltransferase YbiA (DUF1768 family)